MKHVIGRCPECGGAVVEFRQFYGCTNYRPLDGGCRFTLPKKFAGKQIAPHVANELMRQRHSRTLGGFMSRKGNMFTAKLELQHNGKKWRLKMRYPDK